MKFVQGNIFESDAEALVNTVNTVGVMGKGVALQFKERFPENFRLYEAACKRNEVQIGKMFVTATNSMINPRWIINFPTKKHWLHKSSYTYIEAGLDDLVQQIRKLNIRSVAIPPLGAGQGGLNWQKVRALLEKKLSNLDIDIWIYEPSAPAVRASVPVPAKLTKARAMILALIIQYKKLGYEITLLEIQKLAYFLQRMGQEDLRLNYKKFYYGPYAHNLQHLLHMLEQGYIKCEKPIPDSRPFDLVDVYYDNVSNVEQFIENELREEEKLRLNKLIKLMSGYETPFGLELLATVDWILNEARNPELLSEDEIKDRVQNWSNRKGKIFQTEHVKAAKARLREFKSDLYE